MDASVFDVREDTIRVLDYQVLGKLPDPFLRDDGTRIARPEDWPRRRAEIYRTAIELQYGTMPPKPEVFRVEKTYSNSYRIIAGTREKQVSFMMEVLTKLGSKPPYLPVVDGDLCFRYPFNREWLEPMFDNGIAFVVFNRTELANDIQYEGRRHGPLYDVYPEYTFGALGAWAWGYSRCVDALEQIGDFDLSCLAFTGHSRGGKTAMLAGVLDERARIVNPNDTNAGSCSCYRVHMSAVREDGKEARNETLKDLYTRFDYWVGEGMAAYQDCEEKLPFDCHFLKAMVAPRIFLLGEAASDIWTNPIGSYQTSIAAAEVYRFLGCEDNFRWYFRKGVHRHMPEDISMLVENMLHLKYGTPLSTERYFRTPFAKPEPIFDWKRPE